MSIEISIFFYFVVKCGEVFIAETGNQMIVNHAGGLHVGVYNGGTDEFAAAPHQVFA